MILHPVIPHRLGPKDWSTEIHLEGFVITGLVDFHHRSGVRIGCRIVDEDVDRPELRECLFNDRLCAVHVPRVGGDVRNVPADFGRRCPQRVFFARHDHHVCSTANERCGNGLTDSARSTGDERGLSL